MPKSREPLAMPVYIKCTCGGPAHRIDSFVFQCAVCRKKTDVSISGGIEGKDDVEENDHERKPEGNKREKGTLAGY